MNTEALKVIKKLHRKLKKGDTITIWKDEFQVALDGMMPTNYSEEKETESDKQLKFDMACL